MMPFKAAKLGLGVQRPQVNIFDLLASASSFSPAHAVVNYQLGSTGIGSATGNSNWTWLLLGVVADYQVQATLLSGPTPSGTAINSWLSLGSTRAWNYTQALVGETIIELKVEIRRVVDNVVVGSANITLDATVN